MPLYVYQVIKSDGSEGETFEVLQSMNDPVLTVHPDTGEPVRRCISAPSIARKFSELKSTNKLSNRLSDKNLGDNGFTKYVKTGDGSYERSAGKGPKKIQRRK
ncbi:MAG: FmdB family transcriptional regulator [Pirellulales bacterium]